MTSQKQQQKRQQHDGESGGGEFGKFHRVQPERDLESNWEVDLAKKLEDYLLKICSGEITGSEGDDGYSTVNFAEGSALISNLPKKNLFFCSCGFFN